MHEVQEGPASQSYGLQVAQLAGVPRAVIQSARSKLIQLEEGSHSQTINPVSSKPETAPSPKQNDLFIAPIPSESDVTLKALDPDSLTPKQALDLIYELKQLVEKY
jgi:DNA mismatch repair protein MutS